MFGDGISGAGFGYVQLVGSLFARAVPKLYSGLGEVEARLGFTKLELRVVFEGFPGQGRGA